MFVFISYPREFEAAAAALDEELASRNVKTFRDREDMSRGEVWGLEIESNIKKSDVFVVFYPPASEDLFFNVEIGRIKKECEANLKKVITVLFPPAKPQDLPPFLRAHQVLLTNSEGDGKDGADTYWIDQILKQVARPKQMKGLALAGIKTPLEEQIQKTKLWKGIALITLAAAGTIIAALLYNRPLDIGESVVEHSIRFGDRGESICRSLLGSYNLNQNYAFNEGLDTRLLATNARWDAVSCEYNPSTATYTLEGDEKTDFAIEAIINGKYERIATARYSYNSLVYIGKDGRLLKRSINTPILRHEDIKRVNLGDSFNRPEGFIDRKINEALNPPRNKRHLNLNGMQKGCVPVMGEVDEKITIAFICDGYTRTMVKTPDIYRVNNTSDPKLPAGKTDEDYKVVLGGDKRLTLPGTPGELRVWIGSPLIDPRLPSRMVQVERLLPAVGRTAKVTPFAPAFEIDPKESICMGIHPSGSETQFKLRPTETGTFDVGANVLLFSGSDCSGTPVPKSAETLQVTVVVNSDKAFEVRTKQILDIFWEKLLEFWGLLVALFFALLLFLVRGRLKKWFSFGEDK